MQFARDALPTVSFAVASSVCALSSVEKLRGEHDGGNNDRLESRACTFESS